MHFSKGLIASLRPRRVGLSFRNQKFQFLEPVLKSYAALNVVYFNLQKGALHCIHSLKFAFSNVLQLFPQLASF